MRNGLPDLIRELGQELRTVLLGRGGGMDAVLPPLVYAVIAGWLGLAAGVAGALLVGGFLLALRLRKGQSLWYAVGGMGGALLAGGTAWLTAQAEGFFLPGLISGGVTLAIALASALAGRPLVAITSHLARGWPLSWYWHPRVRPAYMEVTWLWVLFFALRLGAGVVAYRRGQLAQLALLSLLSGWPATIVLLVLSYLYGLWRLASLGGPSVTEYQKGIAPPWEGQRRGF